MGDATILRTLVYGDPVFDSIEMRESTTSFAFPSRNHHIFDSETSPAIFFKKTRNILITIFLVLSGTDYDVHQDWVHQGEPRRRRVRCLFQLVHKRNDCKPLRACLSAPDGPCMSVGPVTVYLESGLSLSGRLAALDDAAGVGGRGERAPLHLELRRVLLRRVQHGPCRPRLGLARAEHVEEDMRTCRRCAGTGVC